MAKREVYLSSKQIMAELDFDISRHPALVDSTTNRFYLDMTAVVSELHIIAKREHQMLRKIMRNKTKRLMDPLASSSNFNVKKQGELGTSVALVSEAYGGLFKASIHVHCGLNINLCLLTTEVEAANLALTAQVAHSAPIVTVSPLICCNQLQPQKIPQALPLLQNLPPEIRNLIYTMIFSSQRDSLDIPIHLDDNVFLRALGDPTGFHFPLLERSPLLTVNLATKSEALPIAYRCSAIRAHDMDEVVRLLLAIGEVGRANVEIIDFTWQSAAEISTSMLHSAPSSEWALPSWHAFSCVHLLAKCKRLRLLSIRFDQDLMSDMPLHIFQQDSGINALSSLQRFRAVESLGSIHACHLRNLDGASLRPTPTVHWLQPRMQPSSLEACLRKV